MTEQKMDDNGLIALQWSGDLTIRRIVELKAQLQKALQSARHLSITFAADSECDMSLLQLLCSAHRTASQQGKTLSLCGEFPEQFKMVLKLAGFARHIGCSLDVCGTCLWKLIYQQVAGQENLRADAPTCLSNE